MVVMLGVGDDVVKLAAAVATSMVLVVTKVVVPAIATVGGGGSEMVRCGGSGRLEWSSGVWCPLWVRRSLAGKAEICSEALLRNKTAQDTGERPLNVSFENLEDNLFGYTVYDEDLIYLLILDVRRYIVVLTGGCGCGSEYGVGGDESGGAGWEIEMMVVAAEEMVRCGGPGRFEWSSGVWRRLWVRRSLARKGGRKIWGRRKL
nr:hypothetical protein [Tanacetum cinerariifolium]